MLRGNDTFFRRHRLLLNVPLFDRFIHGLSFE
jgi:hypothetical protein